MEKKAKLMNGETVKRKMEIFQAGFETHGENLSKDMLYDLTNYIVSLL